MTHRYSPLATTGHIHDKLFSSMISVFHGYSLLLCVFVKENTTARKRLGFRADLKINMNSSAS